MADTFVLNEETIRRIARAVRQMESWYVNPAAPRGRGAVIHPGTRIALITAGPSGGACPEFTGVIQELVYDATGACSWVTISDPQSIKDANG